MRIGKGWWSMAEGWDLPFSLPMVAGAERTEEVGEGGGFLESYPILKALLWEGAAPRRNG